jgi:hypothetical protein
MKDIRVIPGRKVTSVYFDGMCWPLPEAALLERLTHGPSSRGDSFAAAQIIRAYVQLVFVDPVTKRQRVIAALRSAREKGERDG